MFFDQILRSTGQFLILPEYNEKEVARANAQCFCYHPLLTIGEHRLSVIEQGESPPALDDNVDPNARKVCKGSLDEATPGSRGRDGSGPSMCESLLNSQNLIEKNFVEDERFVCFR